MLVLTRKYQEKIRIGDNITITVLRTKGKAVRLGIEAPNDIPVIRGELQFETEDHAAEEAEAMAETTAMTSAGVAASKRSRESVADSTWTTKSRPRPARREQSRESVEVEHHRIPRGNVPQIMPQLMPGNGTLRAMLNQRSATL
jgi:carbon storage regulator CsrA